MPEALPRHPDRFFLLLLAPLAAASLPSLLYCCLELILGVRVALAGPAPLFHLPPRSLWDVLFAVQSGLSTRIHRWNSAVTLVATAFFVAALLRPRWRAWTGLALIPYGLLLCADFTLRLRNALLP